MKTALALGLVLIACALSGCTLSQLDFAAEKNTSQSLEETVTR